jgi:flagellar biosynthetic protein FlhB
MAESSFQEKSEPATPKRRREAREEGKVARSQEVNSAFVLFAGLGLLGLAGPFMLGRLMDLTRRLLAESGHVELRADLLMSYFASGVPQVLLILAPVAGAVMIVGLAVNVAQVGFVVSWKPLAPRLSALSPTQGFARMFSKQSGIELLKSMIKVLLVGGIAWLTLRPEISKLSAFVGSDPLPMFGYAGMLTLKLGLRVALAMLFLAIADYAFQRWEYEKSIMMSPKDIEEEMRQTEGDPHIRARVRSVQREMARRRMMSKVKAADVVVTNPTHLAVALRYDRAAMNAPKVVAKGERLIAEKIKEIARQHGVPVVEDRPLARLLFQVGLDREIPVALFRAVAELLASIYRLRAGHRGYATPAP